MLPTVKQFPKLEPRFYNGVWLGKGTTTGESLIGIYNKIARARTSRRQIMPLCTHRSMEDTSISTAYTDSHITSNNAISKQNNSITEGCSNKRSSRKQETKRSTVERTTAKAEEDSRANITYGYITGASETTITASTTARIADKRKR